MAPLRPLRRVSYSGSLPDTGLCAVMVLFWPDLIRGGTSVSTGAMHGSSSESGVTLHSCLVGLRLVMS